MKVLKFGGTSMANASSITCVSDIVKSGKDNKFIVVSAPGKRESTDTKVTDLLYACYDQKMATGVCDNAVAVVEKRFSEITAGLGIVYDMRNEFDIIRSEINAGASKDYVASRGEYLSALVTSKFLGLEFIDATEIIKFDMDGHFDAEKTNDIASKRLAKSKGAVVPGFYGAMPNGKIKTFSRGGSDVTGSIVARAVNASMYENWTDVDGFMACDPRIVSNPNIIDILTYKELRELSYMGANVLHSDCIFPVRKNDISINVRNTFNPKAKGTFIVPTKQFLAGKFPRKETTVTGIAGKKDFVAIYLEKSMMNNELGFARRVLHILEKHNASMEQMPSGIDTLSVILDGAVVSKDDLRFIVSDIKEQCKPDTIEVVENLSLIAIVGHGMNRKMGTAGRVCNALSGAGINIRMIDQGSSELNIIVAVESADYEKAISSLFNEFKNN